MPFLFLSSFGLYCRGEEAGTAFFALAHLLAVLCMGGRYKLLLNVEANIYTKSISQFTEHIGDFVQNIFQGSESDISHKWILSWILGCMHELTERKRGGGDVDIGQGQANSPPLVHCKSSCRQ